MILHAAFAIGFNLSDVTGVKHFVARKEELAQIHAVLGHGRGQRAAVVHGLGGMGKTQLAAAYASHHRGKYSAVFWLNAREEVSLKRSFLKVAGRINREHPSVDYLNNAVARNDLDEAVQAVKQWLELPGNDWWLLVYDNYDCPPMDKNGKGESGEAGVEMETDGDINDAEAYDIRPFLPDGHGAILITTRSARVQIGHRIPLGKLKDPKDSLAILSHTSGRHDLDKGKSP